MLILSHPQNDSPSNVAPCTSFPYITDIHEPSFQNVLRASQCTNGDESARLSSNNFNDPFVTRRNDGHNPLPLSTAGYNSTDSGTIGLPWHPSFKTTRDMLKRRPANAIKMTYMSAKEKVDPEIDSGDQLAMVNFPLETHVWCWYDNTSSVARVSESVSCSF